MNKRFGETPCDCGVCNECMERELNVRGVDNTNTTNKPEQTKPNIDRKTVVEEDENDIVEKKEQTKPKIEGDDVVKFTKDKDNNIAA
jgi:hypothetical protein